VFVRSKLEDQKKAIDLLVKTANKEKKIGYVYDDPESEIYKYVIENYKGNFDFFFRYPVKGKEA